MDRVLETVSIVIPKNFTCVEGEETLEGCTGNPARSQVRSIVERPSWQASASGATIKKSST